MEELSGFGGFGFPVWIRATHWINALFIGFLVRAGIQILGAYPRLYWNDNSTPKTEWLKFTWKKIPEDKPWNGLDQEEDVTTWVGQPGGNNLGLGRHWHFFVVFFWIINGVVYVVALFGTGQWRRLIPTSAQIFPDALRTFVTYASFHLPPESAFKPFDPLQQLTYAALVFLLAPFLIATGLAQSPAIAARFPRYQQFFGGRQSARSLHFLGLLLFVLFTLGHVILVAANGWGEELNKMLFNLEPHMNLAAAWSGIGVIACMIGIYAATSWYSIRKPRRVQHGLGKVIGPQMRALALRARSRQHYKREEISPYFIINGFPPEGEEYRRLAAQNYKDWRLEVNGLVTIPLSLSLSELHRLPKRTQITKHNCIQGWCCVAEWEGVAVSEILGRCLPLPEARYLIFHSYQLDRTGRPFYESLDITLAQDRQMILAYTMNGEPLPLMHGAPLRLRVETLVGYKSVKWLRSIELVEDFRPIRDGQGGSREDSMYYEPWASI